MENISKIIEAEEVKRRNKLLEKPHVFEQIILNSTKLDSMTMLSIIFCWSLHKVKYIVDNVKNKNLSFANAVNNFNN